MKKIIVLVPGYGNILCRVSNYVSDTCIYLTVLTGNKCGGQINVSKNEVVEIPDTENITVIPSPY